MKQYSAAAFPIAMLAVLAGAAIGLQEGLWRLHGRWVDEYSYSHGYLILGMSLWLCYAALKRTGPIPINPSWLGWGALLMSILGYAIAYAIDLTIGMQLMLPVILVCVAAALGGVKLARLLVLPIGFLYFAVPIWDLFIDPLQKAATAVATTILPWFHVTAFIEGSLITTPAGSFEIGEACAGLRFFIVAISLAVFYGLTTYVGWRARMTLVTLAVGVSLVANWIRVVSLILIGHYTNMEHYLIQEEHYLYGWVIFAIAMAPLFWFAPKLERVAPVEADDGGNVQLRPISPSAVILSGLLAGLLLAIPVLIRAPETGEGTAQLALSVDGSEWVTVADPGDWQPSLLPPHQLHAGRYRIRGDNTVVDVIVARYLVQQGEAKAISTRNRLDGGEQVVERGTSMLKGMPINRFKLTHSGNQRLVWYWYHVGGTRVADVRRAKVSELLALLKGRRDAAILALSAPCGISCEGAEQAMLSFYDMYGSRLSELADGAASQRISSE